MDHEKIIKYVLDNCNINEHGPHGVEHWRSVLKYGRELAEKTGADIQVVELFALLHDSCRENDNNDPEHGARAADLARGLNGAFFNLSGDQLDRLRVACRDHSKGFIKVDDITIATCFDADRLDLGRVGCRVNPSRLCTDAARGLIKRTENNIYHYTVKSRLLKILESGKIKINTKTPMHKLFAVWLTTAAKWETCARVPGTSFGLPGKDEVFTKTIDRVVSDGETPARIIIDQSKVDLIPGIEFYKQETIEKFKRDPQPVPKTFLFTFALYCIAFREWWVSFQDIPATAFERCEVWDGQEWVEWSG